MKKNIFYIHKDYKKKINNLDSAEIGLVLLSNQALLMKYWIKYLMR